MNKSIFKKVIASATALSIVSAMVSFPVSSKTVEDVIYTNVYIDRVTVSLEEAESGPIPVYVRLTNSFPDGFNGYEFGIEVDERCSVMATAASGTAYAFGGEPIHSPATFRFSPVVGYENFVWLIGTSDYGFFTPDKDGNIDNPLNILMFVITIPDPQPGEIYTINHAEKGVGNDEEARPADFSFGHTHLTDIVYTDGWIKIEDEPDTEPSTEPVPTEPTTEPDTDPIEPNPSDDYRFVDGADNWSFPNSRSNFGNTYFMLDEYWNKLLGGLSNTEKARMRDYVKNAYWGGSCYGMAATSILACYDILNPADYQEDAVFLHDIDAPPTEEMKSLINYYFALQFTDVMQQEICENFYSDDEKAKLQSLLACLEDGSPTLLCYHGYFYGFSWGGHAVVAYDVEYGTYSYNGKAYNGKIVTYDNNSVDYDDDYCLYFNTSNWSWTIPYYELDSSKGSILGLITDDLDYVNYHGYLDGTSSVSTDDYIAVLQSAALSGDFRLIKTNYANGMWTNAATSDNDIKMFSALTDSFDYNNIMFAMKDASAGYILKTQKPEKMDLSLSYENSLLNATASAGTDTRFSPSGCVEVNGKDTDYSIEIVLDDGYMVTDWYSFAVSGSDVDKAVFEKSEDGYVLSATNLNRVTAKAYNDNTAASITFSTDYNEVLLYEVDENTIGVAVDTDGNGSFETTIAKSTKGVKGDVSGDGEFSILDIIVMQKYLLNVGYLSDYESGDLCQDGVIDAFDLAMMKRMLLENK